MIYIFLKKYKKYGIIALLFLIFAIGISDFLSVNLFKEVFKRLRPCHNEEILNVVHLVNGHCGGKYGFISSHAANFFALATFSSLFLKNRYFTFIIFFIAVLVAYSRIYLGVHYPLDVFCGAIFGSFISILFYLLFKKLLKKNNNELISYF
jgi:undecaprenyl-diphosphatase